MTTESVGTPGQITVTTPALTVHILGDARGISRIVLMATSEAPAESGHERSSLKRVLASGFQMPRDGSFISSGSADGDRNLQRASQQMARYLSGTPVAWSFRCAPVHGTHWEERVWAALRQIPFGHVNTYGWLARGLGSPGASRAVGQALGKNPLPIVVPCHRIVSTDGSLGGFSSGLKVKRHLLILEGSLTPGFETTKSNR